MARTVADVAAVETSGQPASAEHRTGLSQWDLIKIKFRRNSLAVISGWVLIVVYAVVVFADFLAPYPISLKHEQYVNAPPMRLHVFHQGRVVRPFVYGYNYTTDPKTYLRHYVVDETQRYPIYFFVEGGEYELLGLFPTSVHFFGVGPDSRVFLAGTDRFGQDLLSRMLSGARVSLTAGLLSVVISLVLGSILGTMSGFYGGTTDMVIQRIVEFLQSFPRIPLWLTLSAALPPYWSSIRVYFGIVTILAFLGWTGLAREVRAKVLTMRANDYSTAAMAAGASNWYIITRHMVPNALSHIIVVATLAVPGMILGEASLSFLGLGIQPPMTSLGVLLQEAQNIRTIANYPWQFTPALVIIVSILAFNFLGDGLRDAVDPYSR